jgi:hypothetical protein
MRLSPPTMPRRLAPGMTALQWSAALAAAAALVVLLIGACRLALAYLTLD